MGRIFDGKRMAVRLQEEVAVDIANLGSRGLQLTLAVVLVGDHPASAAYVRGKQRVAEKVGLNSRLIRLPADVAASVLLDQVELLNQDDDVDGILVQLPLPRHVTEHAVLDRIRPDKDVDGFHPQNAGRNFTGLSAVWPCTPAGIMELLRYEGVALAGKHAVVVGRSNIVGKPMALLLLAANATVTVCHSATQGLQFFTSQADVLVAAVGQPGLIRAEHVKPGATVVDVGMNRVDGKLVGDVDFDDVLPVCSLITPVPGGVGPLTIAMLMKNTVMLGKRRRRT